MAEQNKYPCFCYVYRLYWDDSSESYVGSTTDVERRMCEHRNDKNNQNMKVSKEIKRRGGAFLCEIIDNVWVKSKDDPAGRKLERKWQDDLDPSLNEKRAYYTEEDRKASRAKYEARPEVKAKKRAYLARPEIKAKIKAYKAEYNARPGIKAKIKAYRAEYLARPGIKAKIKAYDAEYLARPEVKARKRAYDAEYRTRPEKKAAEAKYRARPEVKAKRAEKIACECGSAISRGNISAHRRTKKHQSWEQAQK